MEQSWHEQLNVIQESLPFFVPELILSILFLLLIVVGLLKANRAVLLAVAVAGFSLTLSLVAVAMSDEFAILFNGAITVDGLSSYLKMLIDIAGIFTCVLFVTPKNGPRSEYLALVTAVILGGHILVMSNNFLLLFLSLELISLASYVLAGFSFDKKGSEGSLKYFLFGATASAVMLYGFSLLYGFTGTLNFSEEQFFRILLNEDSPLILIGSFMVLAGLFYKITAAPMHLWVPDVYEAAPIPVIAFFSVVPKLAGFGILIKFILAIHLFGQSPYDWQTVLALVSILTITVGNFSALVQTNAKRMMAYSSIAHSGFLLVGVSALLPEGIHFMLFYASIYLVMNFLVFSYLDRFDSLGVSTIKAFSGAGKKFPFSMVMMLVGLISLTGLPPTAGFTAKLFVFSGLWESFQISHKPILIWLFVFGLLNTAVSLFYYLRIPWLAFLREPSGAVGFPERNRGAVSPNLFGLILVLIVLGLFFMPALLMGWINKINFVQ